MHLRLCAEPLLKTQLEDFEPLRLNDGSIVEAFEDPASIQYFERVTYPDGKTRWYRVTSDEVVTV